MTPNGIDFFVPFLCFSTIGKTRCPLQAKEGCRRLTQAPVEEVGEGCVSVGSGL